MSNLEKLKVNIEELKSVIMKEKPKFKKDQSINTYHKSQFQNDCSTEPYNDDIKGFSQYYMEWNNRYNNQIHQQNYIHPQRNYYNQYQNIPNANYYHQENPYQIQHFNQQPELQQIKFQKKINNNNSLMRSANEPKYKNPAPIIQIGDTSYPRFNHYDLTNYQQYQSYEPLSRIPTAIYPNDPSHNQQNQDEYSYYGAQQAQEQYQSYQQSSDPPSSSDQNQSKKKKKKKKGKRYQRENKLRRNSRRQQLKQFDIQETIKKDKGQNLKQQQNQNGIKRSAKQCIKQWSDPKFSKAQKQQYVAKVFCQIGPGFTIAQQALRMNKQKPKQSKEQGYKERSIYANLLTQVIRQSFRQIENLVVNQLQTEKLSNEQFQQLRTALCNCRSWMGRKQLQTFLNFTKICYKLPTDIKPEFHDLVSVYKKLMLALRQKSTKKQAKKNQFRRSV